MENDCLFCSLLCQEGSERKEIGKEGGDGEGGV